MDSVIAGTQSSPSTSSATAATAGGSSKIPQAARDFESILLGQWLQNAESSFASVPGGDDDEDSCGEQMQGFAMQRLAGQLTASGGIGIARMVEKALVDARGREESDSSGAASASTSAGKAEAQSAAMTQSANSAVAAYSAQEN
jgi:Rod binding domain-containing protein